MSEENNNEEVAKIDNDSLPALVEALLLAYGDPLSITLLCETTKATAEEVRAAITVLASRYEQDSSGMFIAEVGQKVQLRSKPEFSEYIQLVKSGRPRRLSPAALETLSIIAYRQPVVKHDIEKIRGVDVTPTLKTLLDRKLIKIIGHQATVGQPALYSTSEEFLSIFGLSSLDELPNLRDLDELEGSQGETQESEEVEVTVEASLEENELETELSEVAEVRESEDSSLSESSVS